MSAHLARSFVASLLLGAFGGATALAGGELQLESSMPVVLKLDGETIGTVQPLEPLLIDIEGGVHNVTISGLLGKELYNRDLIFDDDTRTELIWQRKELRLGQVVPLDPDRAKSTEPAPEPEPEPEPTRQAAAPSPPPAPAAQVAQAPAPAPASPPPPRTELSQVFGDDRAQASHAAVATPAPGPAPSPRSRGVVIQATDTLDLRIAHGAQLLRITVENGELVVRDAAGHQIRFPSTGDAF